VADRKVRFHELNEFVRSRNGWITSVFAGEGTDLVKTPLATYITVADIPQVAGLVQTGVVRFGVLLVALFGRSCLS
jgi:hypothetical protein